MPFQSEKQRRFLHANHPEIAKRWEREYATGGISNHFRKRFASGTWTPGAGRDKQGYQKSHPSYGGGNGGTGGDGPKPHSGPTFAEIEAQKKAAAAAAAAEKKAIADAQHKEWISRKDKKKKKVEYVHNLNPRKINSETIEDIRLTNGKSKTFITDKYSIEDLITGNIDRHTNVVTPNLGTISTHLGPYNATGPQSWAVNPGKPRDYDFSEIEGQEAKLTGLALAQKRVLEKKKGMEEFGGETFTSEDQKFLDKLIEMDKEETVYSKPITAIGAKGGVARKNYYHGGILDINESEEIISDDGNDIELTDYNAAFDEPTGVRTLFMKKGGNVRLGPHTATDLLAKKNPDGTRSKYQPPGGGETSLGSGAAYSGGASDRGPRDDPDRFGPVSKPQTVPSGINIHADTGDEEEAYEMVGGRKLHESKWGTSLDPREKYDTEKAMLTGIYGTTKKGINEKHAYTTGRTKAAYELALRNQKAKMKSMGKGKLIPALIAFVVSGFNPAAAMSTFKVSKIDMLNIVKNSIPVMQAKKAHIASLEDAKKELLGLVDINNPNTMKNLDDTNLEDINKQLKDLTKTEEDDTKGDGPEVPKVVPVHEEIEEYEGTYAMSPWDRIKANQAKRAMLVEKGVIQENPVVDESVTDITMQANSGGLANLFRVKNQ